MGNDELKVKIQMVVILRDSNFNPSSPKHYKALVDEDGNFPSLFLKNSDKSLDAAFSILYNEFLKPKIGWAKKEISEVEKVEDVVVITYKLLMPYLDCINKRGSIKLLEEIL